MTGARLSRDALGATEGGTKSRRVDAQLEGLASVDQHDRNLFAVEADELVVRIDVDDREIEGALGAHLVEEVFHDVTQVTVNSRVQGDGSRHEVAPLSKRRRRRSNPRRP
jgi:hypothetical protein